LVKRKLRERERDTGDNEKGVGKEGEHAGM
jgi:hypothetical protein